LLVKEEAHFLLLNAIKLFPDVRIVTEEGNSKLAGSCFLRQTQPLLNTLFIEGKGKGSCQRCLMAGEKSSNNNNTFKRYAEVISG
jgi:hypothetical protein